jgi:hypothetical protein
MPGFDNQRAIFDPGVFPIVPISLQFLIKRPRRENLVNPLFGIRRTFIIELFIPYQLPLRRIIDAGGKLRSAGNERDQYHNEQNRRNRSPYGWVDFIQIFHAASFSGPSLKTDGCAAFSALAAGSEEKQGPEKNPRTSI